MESLKNQQIKALKLAIKQWELMGSLGYSKHDAYRICGGVRGETDCFLCDEFSKEECSDCPDCPWPEYDEKDRIGSIRRCVDGITSPYRFWQESEPGQQRCDAAKAMVDFLSSLLMDLEEEE